MKRFFRGYGKKDGSGSFTVIPWKIGIKLAASVGYAWRMGAEAQLRIVGRRSCDGNLFNNQADS